LIGGNLAGLTIPVLAFMLHSYLKHGETGLKSYANQPQPATPKMQRRFWSNTN
jgi:hypothetical protein